MHLEVTHVSVQEGSSNEKITILHSYNPNPRSPSLIKYEGNFLPFVHRLRIASATQPPPIDRWVCRVCFQIKTIVGCRTVCRKMRAKVVALLTVSVGAPLPISAIMTSYTIVLATDVTVISRRSYCCRPDFSHRCSPRCRARFPLLRWHRARRVRLCWTRPGLGHG